MKKSKLIMILGLATLLGCKSQFQKNGKYNGYNALIGEDDSGRFVVLGDTILYSSRGTRLAYVEGRDYNNDGNFDKIVFHEQKDIFKQNSFDNKYHPLIDYTNVDSLEKIYKAMK